MRRSRPGTASIPSAPSVVETMAFPIAMASTILRRVPPPSRSGTTMAAAAARCGRRSGTKPVSSTRGPASARSDGGGRPPMILKRALGVRLGDAGPDVLNEVDHAIDIRNGGEEPEIDNGAAVRRRVRGARLVVVDVRRVGNDRRASPGNLVQQALLVHRAAQIDSIGVPVGPQLLPPQLAPVGPGVKTTVQAAAGARKLPSQVVGDLVRVHHQGRQPLAGRSLAQVTVAKVTRTPG